MIQLKKKLLKGVLRLAFLLCVFSTTSVYSQIAFDDDVDECTPAAPIDDWMLPAMLVAIGLVFINFHKNLRNV
jgi:hypothetical protein